MKLLAAEQKANGFEDAPASRHETLDGEYGCIETRKYAAIHDIGWLRDRPASCSIAAGQDHDLVLIDHEV